MKGIFGGVHPNVKHVASLRTRDSRGGFQDPGHVLLNVVELAERSVAAPAVDFALREVLRKYTRERQRRNMPQHPVAIVTGAASGIGNNTGEALGCGRL